MPVDSTAWCVTTACSARSCSAKHASAAGPMPTSTATGWRSMLAMLPEPASALIFECMNSSWACSMQARLLKSRCRRGPSLTSETAHLLPAPMQLPTQGQKWSNMATQRLLTEQCLALSGRTICRPSNRAQPQTPGSHPQGHTAGTLPPCTPKRPHQVRIQEASEQLRALRLRHSQCPWLQPTDERMGIRTAAGKQACVCRHKTNPHLAGDAQLAPVASSQGWRVQSLQPIILEAALALLSLHSITLGSSTVHEQAPAPGVRSAAPRKTLSTSAT